MKEREEPIPPWDERFHARIRQAGEVLVPQLDGIVDTFYSWLMSEGDGQRFLTSAQVASLKALQKIHWQEFFSGTVDAAYVASRRRVARIHAGLDRGSHL